ncbi:flagellar basal-body MS-ring/collar protein FliF [Microbacterium sp. CIAB417]|uniref:flagellar basal-body MS-ring/collar protein FliF n=1 Tax=Microbacterium sp. CIAB417 TaxID=2860287 RepID=UPI001FAC3AD3|nr:flagellar basal-body MS-ring/collar protein FliF [Microbacterium sp. CIAB417]
MPKAVTGVFQRLGRAVAGFTLAQRTFAIIGIAAVLLGAIALVSWMSRPHMTPLFSGLSATDANTVVEQLRSAGVSYELTDGGGTVLVPEADVYNQRLTAAAAGIPSASSGGYTLLDEMGVTSSEFQQSVTYKRAIEGELAATIAALDGVSAASVQLAIPEESVFVSETVDPTASVFVETDGSTAVSADQVEAIVHLTSASVSGLKAENVAVIDQTGTTLSAVGTGTVGGVDQQSGEHEARVTAAVQQMLDAVVGAGNAKVSVVAEIDRSVSERLEETYTPAEGAPPLSEQTRTETSNGGDTDAGVLGPDNIAVPDGAGDGAYESTEETRNNVVNKLVESTTTPAGSITRQSVSVAVDADAATDITVAQLEDLVAAAAGIDPQRGDGLSVELVSFSQTDADAAQAALQSAKEAAEAERLSALTTALIIAAAIAVPLLAGVIAHLVRTRRRARKQDEFDSLFGERPPPLSELPAATDPFRTAQTALEQQAPTAVLEVTPPEPDPELERELNSEPAQVSLERRRAELDALTRSDPQRTAELMRSFLDDRAAV